MKNQYLYMFMFGIALGLSPLETITVAISGTIFIVAFACISIKGDKNKIAKELIEDNQAENK